MAVKDKKVRSTLPKDQARQRYVEIGEIVVLEQIQKDSKALDDRSIPVGPFVRLDANDVAARDGKTRGAISNLFGNQTEFQAETMALALSARDWIARVEFPALEDCPTAEAWVDAFFTGQAARGPQHGGKPKTDYGFLWALWLTVLPYGLWSKEISRSSLEEHVQWIDRLKQVLSEAIKHYGVRLREGVTVTDLACAIASLIEGVWLNQLLSNKHPCEPTEPIAAAMRRAGRLLWQGAISPRGTKRA